MRFVPSAFPLAEHTPRAWQFAFVGSQILLPDIDGAELVPSDWPAFDVPPPSRHYLGRLDELDVWACVLAEVPSGWRAVGLRAAMMQFPAPLMALAGRAAQVVEWDRAHRYCGVCGTPTEPHARERSRVCPACAHVAYPRVSPAMMALVWREGEVLLARAPHFAPGMFSALAGFVEPGESLEECVAREVAEEVGVTVADLRYYGSQSWPFPHSLMLACTARWTGGEIVPQPDEIEEAGWYPIDALPKVPPRFSIAGHLIRDTVAALQRSGGTSVG